MQTVRLRFEKKGRVRYISHLDLVRCMERAISRSGIKIWYTQGFNPRAYLLFGLPLSLGTESTCEVCDLRLEEELPLQELKERLNASLPDGLQIVDCYPEAQPMKVISWASYSTDVYLLSPLGEEEVGQAETLLSTQPLVVAKRSKSGVRDTDISPLIKTIQVALDSSQHLVLTSVVAAGSAQNLNPELLVTVLQEKLGFAVDYAKHLRRDIYDANMQSFH